MTTQIKRIILTACLQWRILLDEQQWRLEYSAKSVVTWSRPSVAWSEQQQQRKKEKDGI